MAQPPKTRRFRSRHLLGEYAVTRHGWRVRFGNCGPNKATSKGDGLLRMVPAIRAIVENGNVVNTEPGRDATTKWKHWIAAPVEIDGEVKDVAISIRETPDGFFHYELTWDNGERAQHEADGDQAQGPVGPVWNQPSLDLNIGLLAENFNAETPTINFSRLRETLPDLRKRLGA